MSVSSISCSVITCAGSSSRNSIPSFVDSLTVEALKIWNNTPSERLGGTKRVEEALEIWSNNSAEKIQALDILSITSMTSAKKHDRLEEALLIWNSTSISKKQECERSSSGNSISYYLDMMAEEAFDIWNDRQRENRMKQNLKTIDGASCVTLNISDAQIHEDGWFSQSHTDTKRASDIHEGPSQSAPTGALGDVPRARHSHTSAWMTQSGNYDRLFRAHIQCLCCLADQTNRMYQRTTQETLDSVGANCTPLNFSDAKIRNDGSFSHSHSKRAGSIPEETLWQPTSSSALDDMRREQASEYNRLHRTHLQRLRFAELR